MASSSQHKFRRVHLLSSAFASLTIAAPPAYAADDPVEAGGDIIVTAQKRDQRLIDVPSAVSVLSPEALREAGVKDLVDASRLTPGVVVSPQFVGGRTIQTLLYRTRQLPGCQRVFSGQCAAGRKVFRPPHRDRLGAQLHQ
ncbi:hypothetical protein [Sphingomonas echinoides]|uniref:TonB-dependent receptor n=1 Tax=Sphingomonas echinoides TaxID=59803 RepID=A0ABU4PRD5_9SPHN|nr:hypothetical protein [Sphingomonas echinoides]MDX5986372.1 hypothetical protein [Sphingomonas echinoides]